MVGEGESVVLFYAYLDSDVPGNGRWSRWRQSAGHVLTRSSDLGEVFSRRKDLFFRLGDVLLASRHHEHGFLAAYWRLDIRVGLGAQGLDFATWTQHKRPTINNNDNSGGYNIA